jgi:hypothetical protein
MASAAREYLMVVEESAYGTPVSTPTIWTTATTYGLANAQAYYCRLDESNAFTMGPDPIQKELMYGGGVAVPAIRVSDKLECKGSLKMQLTVLTAPFWLSWCGIKINAGQTAPWVTTEPPNDLASCTIYHAIEMINGTVKRRGFLGVKPDGFTLESSADGTTWTLTIPLVGSQPIGNQFNSATDPTAGTFPVPLETYFPVDPFLFQHGNGLFTIGGSARTQYTSQKISVANKMYGQYFPSTAPFLSMYHMAGRTVDVDSKIIYSTSPDDRTTYEGLTHETASFGLNNGTHGFVMNMESTNVYTKVREDLPIDNLYMFDEASRVLFDVTSGTDFGLSFT